MSNYILMVFEGEVTEKLIFDNLKQYFLNTHPNTIVYGFHCGEIYSLYNKLKKDENLELFPLLKEQLKTKNSDLQNIEKSHVSEIYLFFDYDGHAATANYTKLQEMLSLFNNETDQGKLYISYPMVEAIRHLKSDTNFQNTTAQSHPDYKKISRHNCDENLKSCSQYSIQIWNHLIDQHCKKANFIVNDLFEFPESSIEQLSILANQKIKYINPHNIVSVVSAFPLFLADYYGYNTFKTIPTPTE